MGRKDMQMCRRLLAIIRRHGDIHMYDLIDEANISLGQYYLVKAYFSNRFVEWVKYDKGSKTWSVINPDLQTGPQNELAPEVREDAK